jgi:hypothetical protein
MSILQRSTLDSWLGMTPQQRRRHLQDKMPGQPVVCEMNSPWGRASARSSPPRKATCATGRNVLRVATLSKISVTRAVILVSADRGTP